ncbi:MAG: helix-turn-helix domain-containing protein [Betaproteobacteria bacterium]|nr:helix-turn-helix domain-containing protein [Betaproteobacteria bacterium]
MQHPADVSPASAPRCIAFVLLPRFAFGALGAAQCAIEAYNEVCEGTPIATLLLGETAKVTSQGGLELAALPVEGALPAFDALLVLADSPLPETGHEALIGLLQREAARGTVLGGFGTGAWLLARAGVLDQHRATLHWPYTGMLAERFPRIIGSAHVFELDRARLTAAGGAAALEAMAAWLTRPLSAEAAADVLDQLGVERIRGAGERQRVPLAARIGGGQPKLTEAVKLMEANFEEPLPTEDIARLVGVSRRQLERLFKQHLNSLPSRYYLEMRLNRARQLLRETSQSILQVGLSCGFSSGPHFSSAYRAHFDTTPREERSRRMFGTGASRKEDP